MLPLTQAQRYYGRIYGCDKSSSKFRRQNSQFFRKPYLEIDSDLVKIEKKVTVGKQMHVFDSIIWALKVKNVKEHRFNLPLTITALNCKSTINFTTIGQSAPLVWRVGREEPGECATDGQPQTQRADYLGLLGSYYAKEQLADRCGVDSIILNPDETHELYFLFTFRESKYAYIITPIEFTNWYGEREIHYCSMNGAFYFFKFRANMTS